MRPQGIAHPLTGEGEATTGQLVRQVADLGAGRYLFHPEEKAMKTMKTLLITCGLALGLLSAAGAEARAENYGVVTISNPTSVTINYQFQWGDGGWVDYSLPPNSYRCHYHGLDAANRAPTPSVRFDNGVGNVKQYRLDFYAANWVNYYSGKKYHFAWSWPYLDLYSG
jgi:hypothetical protein